MTRKIYICLIAVNLALAAWFSGVFAFGGSDDRWLLVAVGHMSLPALLLFPVYANRRIEAAEPMTLLVVFVVIGTLSTTYLLSFTDTARRTYLMAGKELDAFVVGGLWLCGGLLVTGLGYAACTRRMPVERMIPGDALIHKTGITLASMIVLLVSLAAIVQYVESTGGFTSLADLSRKRSIEIVSEGEIVYGNAAYIKLVGTLCVWLLYMSFSYYLGQDRKLSLSAKVLFALILLVSMAIPFLASSRASIGYTLIGLLMIYSLRRGLSPSLLVGACLAFLILFSAMTGLRSLSQARMGQGGEVFINPVFALAESGNGLSIVGTTHIIDGVPERMDYQLGTTFLTWVTAPIPRSVWPQKPDVSLGKRIKGEIMQETVIRTGRPPSILTEGYINFGAIGFFVVSFAFGYVMRLVANSFLPVIGASSLAITIYYASILNLGALANAALSQAVVRQLSDTIAIVLVYMVMTRTITLSRRRQVRAA